MLIQLAFKNIMRNKKRTLLTVSAVFFGVFLVVIAKGFNDGLGARTANLFIHAATGAAKVVSQSYQLESVENPLDYPINKYQPIISQLKADPRIQAIAPRISFRGSLSNGSDEIDLTGIGVEPVNEERVFNRSTNITAGSFLKENQTGIVIGKKLGEILDLKVGDTVTVIARATEMGYNALDLEIVGLIDTGNQMIDENTFFVSIGFARQFLSFSGITDIAIAVKQLSQLETVIGDFEKHKNLNSVKMMGWKYFARDYLTIIGIQNKKIGFLSLTILLMAGAGITNTMLMAMMERKREIANFMALGVQRREIIELFLFEGLAIGFVGSLLGLITGAVLIGVFKATGTKFGSATPVFPISGYVYFLIGIKLAILSSIYPAKQATKLLPVEVLRNNQG
jgi:putative ABC transport system permease protein